MHISLVSWFSAWLFLVIEVKLSSVVARVINIHTKLSSSKSKSFSHSVAPLLLHHFTHSFSSELESLQCPTQALSGPGEDSSESPISPALHSSQAPLYSMSPAPSWEAH